jgi:hypothetical protein
VLATASPPGEDGGHAARGGGVKGPGGVGRRAGLQSGPILSFSNHALSLLDVLRRGVDLGVAIAEKRAAFEALAAWHDLILNPQPNVVQLRPEKIG